MSFITNLFKSPSRKPRLSKPPISIPPIDKTEDIPFDSTIPYSMVIKIPHTGSLRPIGMSYWRNINFHKHDPFLKVLLSINDQLTIFTLSKYNLEVINVTPLEFHHTGEGCFWSVQNSNLLYIPLGNEMLAVDVTTGEKEIIFKLPTNEIIWQAHTGFYENTWSCSVKDANSYQIKHWLIFKNNIYKPYDIVGEPDECQIDKSEDWFLIKEDNLNRIFNIKDNRNYTILNEEGALGHSDMCFNGALGEDDYNNEPGALVYWNFETMEKKLIYSTGIWNMGYFSFTNAIPNLPIEKQKGLITTPNELVSVGLDAWGAGMEVCPIIPWNKDTPYDHRPKANLCPLGNYACWTEFENEQLVAKIVRVPSW